MGACGVGGTSAVGEDGVVVVEEEGMGMASTSMWRADFLLVVPAIVANMDVDMGGAGRAFIGLDLFCVYFLWRFGMCEGAFFIFFIFFLFFYFDVYVYVCIRRTRIQ